MKIETLKTNILNDSLLSEEGKSRVLFYVEFIASLEDRYKKQKKSRKEIKNQLNQMIFEGVL